MTPADLATANAIHFEGVKHAYRQTKDGVVISFVVHPHDVPKGLAEAPLGSRYIVALVQVGDDEQAIQTKEVMPNPQPSNNIIDARPLSAPKSAGAKRDKRDWRDVPPTEQAGIRCDDAVFEAFLREQYADDWIACEYNAADVVRFLCGVNSRSAFGVNHAARMIWKQLDDQFQAWQRVGA
jgi:hypothetical protein